jgi:sialic acid synthase SpsE/sugar phosphate isomerase/epimerase
MFIRKNISSLIADSDASILSVLKKIEQNKRKLVYVVDEHNTLIGSFADGDFRRLLIEQETCNLSASVGSFVNLGCYSLPFGSDPSVIRSALNSKGFSIPLVDEFNRIIAVAELGAKFFEISGRRISEEDPTYIIAEIGNNHQGCLTTAKKLVELAAAAGVDCVKFQMRDMEALYGEGSTDNHDLGSQYTLDLLNKYQLTNEQLFEIFDHCKEHGVTPLCTPWDIRSLNRLEGYGFDAYKVSSADFTNYELLAAVAITGKLMICSTGMSTEDEIRSTVDFLERHKASFILLHCNSTYPTPYKDVNLKYLSRIQIISNTLVGYSGHERGWSVPVAAVALGAKVIEKHFTLDKSQEGNDHKVSLLPNELGEMVKDIRAVEKALGHDRYRELTQGELMNREVLAKSLFATRDIVFGEVVHEKDVCVRGPGNGIQPNRIYQLLGKKMQRAIAKNEAFFESDISGLVKKKSRYFFNRPVGIPVRYHDYRELTRDVELDFVEFHLSYADMELDLTRYLEHDSHMGFAVHAPELFPNDHLLDLTSFDQDYRAQSIKHLQRVIEHTHQLKRFFPKTVCPVIVINAGGWNTDRFWSRAEVAEKYELVKSALVQIDSSGVKLAIQSMPPFPWHFGGQSHHSLFVLPDDCVKFCEESDVSICLDLSHSMMACNYYETSIYEFVEKVAPYTSHFHIVDAKGVDGEGIQIGHGDVDFRRVSKLIDRFAPGVQFIPEIWQGHNNNGEGFWNALAYLESKLS